MIWLGRGSYSRSCCSRVTTLTTGFQRGDQPGLRPQMPPWSLTSTCTVAVRCQCNQLRTLLTLATSVRFIGTCVFRLDTLAKSSSNVGRRQILLVGGRWGLPRLSSHFPYPGCIGQTREHFPYVRSHVSIPQPAAVNNPPQPICESKLRRLGWFTRFSPLDDCLNYIAFQIPIGRFFTQNLTFSGYC